MTHTFTETHEQRVWRLALEATDRTLSEAARQTRRDDLARFLLSLSEGSKAQVAAAARLLTPEPAGTEKTPFSEQLTLGVVDYESGTDVDLSAHVSKRWWASVRPGDKLLATVTKVTEKTTRS